MKMVCAFENLYGNIKGYLEEHDEAKVDDIICEALAEEDMFLQMFSKLRHL